MGFRGGGGEIKKKKEGDEGGEQSEIRVMFRGKRSGRRLMLG